MKDGLRLIVLKWLNKNEFSYFLSVFDLLIVVQFSNSKKKYKFTSCYWSLSTHPESQTFSRAIEKEHSMKAANFNQGNIKKSIWIKT